MGGEPAIQFFHVAVTIETTDAVELHAHHAPVLYALTGQANGVARNESAFFPDGVMIDAPEQCRVHLSPHSTFRFGWTLCLPDADEARRLVGTLLHGLERVGGMPPIRGMPLRGNFVVLGAHDLVADGPIRAGEPVTPVSSKCIAEEIDRCHRRKHLTLRFTTPLRMPRWQSTRTPGHAHLDSDQFDTERFLRGVEQRLRRLGLHGAPASPGTLTLAENRLIWLDIAYNAGKNAKTLGGACGEVQVECRDPSAVATLVLGQRARVGQNTRFGFGCYRIRELGPDPHAATRSVTLLDLALSGSELDRAVERYDLRSGAAAELRHQIRDGRYRPDQCTRVPIPKGDGSVRVLAIPSRRDRSLQRAVHAQLAPGIDRFLEESSLAYRQGLGRARAAAVIRRAYSRGYRFALRTDFARFFDSIDHSLLEARLDAYLNDPATVSLLMHWVRAGSPHDTRGIPTGAPISPLLANLFLDRFDEMIAAEGGLLVRYADDFVVLYRTEAEARTAFERLGELARSLELSLNEQKTGLVDLSNSFEFLGYRFERRQRWVALPMHKPCPVDELGWRQAEPPLRSHLFDRSHPFEVFEHPDEDAP